MEEHEIVQAYKKGRSIASLAQQLKYIMDAKIKENKKDLGKKGRAASCPLKEARLKVEMIIVKNWEDITREAVTK
jgi:hypothetical protein